MSYITKEDILQSLGPDELDDLVILDDAKIYTAITRAEGEFNMLCGAKLSLVKVDEKVKEIICDIAIYKLFKYNPHNKIQLKRVLAYNGDGNPEYVGSAIWFINRLIAGISVSKLDTVKDENGEDVGQTVWSGNDTLKDKYETW